MKYNKICEEQGHDWGEWEYQGTYKPLIRECRRCFATQTRPAVGCRTPRIVYRPRVAVR